MQDGVADNGLDCVVGDGALSLEAVDGATGLDSLQEGTRGGVLELDSGGTHCSSFDEDEDVKDGGMKVLVAIAWIVGSERQDEGGAELSLFVIDGGTVWPALQFRSGPGQPFIGGGPIRAPAGPRSCLSAAPRDEKSWGPICNFLCQLAPSSLDLWWLTHSSHGNLVSTKQRRISAVAIAHTSVYIRNSA